MKKKGLKIAIFHLAFFYSGGGEKLVLEEMKGLRKRGYEVDCFSPVVEKSLCFPDIIDDFNIKTIFPQIPRFFERQETLDIVITCLFFPFIARRFRKYDIILGANQPGPWFGWLIKKLTGKPYVVYLAQPTRILYPRRVDIETGFWVKEKSRLFPVLVKLTKPFIRWLDRISIRGADKMLVNGGYMAKVLEKVYNKEPIICPAGAHLFKRIAGDRWQGSIEINSYTIKKPYILVTNRHFPQKRFEYVIKNLPKVLKKVPGVSLVITGNPTDYTDFLKGLVKKLSLENKVLFTGFISEKDLQELYGYAAVYVYTSPEEDFGMGVIEAMACGVPVVAWDKAGPSTTIINGKTGFLVKPGSESEFAKKIISLLEQKNMNLAMGREAMNHVRKNYTYTKHNNLLEKALIQVVG